MLKHAIEIEGGKAIITWRDRKVKAFTVEFKEPVEVDPLAKMFDLRPEFSRYLQGLNLVHEKTAEFLDSADMIKNMSIEQVPKEIGRLFAQGPGETQDKIGFDKFKREMSKKARKQIIETKENTEIHGKRYKTKGMLRKSPCDCNAMCYIHKKKDGTYWWKCKECGEEVRAKRTDVTERQVIFMVDEISK